MALNVKNIKGMPDLLPSQTALWQYIESQLQQLLNSYGYREIRMPVVEYTDLFKRSIGEVTDIVEKEMYTFPDRHGDLLTLRPEGTASCVRAAQQNALLDNAAQQRLWYMGPMFRYENPQKGRQRQFTQFGVETFGIASADIDAELIVIAWRLWQRLGLSESVTLELNSIGSIEARSAYKSALVEHLSQVKDQLDSDSQRRLNSNPLRILDSKSPQTQSLLMDAPVLSDYLDDDAKTHFAHLCATLDRHGINYVVNPKLVRGLDYYNKTVFEWVTDKLGAQGTVCAGGRYDGLVEQLGGKSVPAVGFAMGLERLTLLVESCGNAPKDLNNQDVYFVVAGDEEVKKEAAFIAENLRHSMPQLRMTTHCGGGSIKSQMKKADKSGAQFAIIVGSNEIDQQQVMLKPLRAELSRNNTSLTTEKIEQKSVAVDDLVSVLQQYLV